MGGACQGQKHGFLLCYTHIHTHLHRHALKHTPLPSPPISRTSPHLSLWQEKEGGRNRAMEGEEGGRQQTINCVTGWWGRNTQREQDWEKRERKRENNKVSLVGINLPHTAGVSVEASWWLMPRFAYSGHRQELAHQAATHEGFNCRCGWKTGRFVAGTQKGQRGQ